MSFPDALLDTIAVIDFETTGHSPQGGGRATEIAAVLVRDGAIVGQYQSLMNTGAWVPPFIERLTGISNEMLEQAPDAAQVMREVDRFAAGCGMVAHNASFDRGFWLHELQRADCAPERAPEFACTVKLARRLYPEAPNCKLGTLARHHALPNNGRAHRALADALTTAQLLLRMQQDLQREFSEQLQGLPVRHELLARLQGVTRPQFGRCVAAYARELSQRRQACLSLA